MADTRLQTRCRITYIPMRSGQNIQPDEQRAIQESISSPKTVTRDRMQLPKPNWPTSRPGPLAMQPPLGQRPINVLRREQMVEVG